MLPVKLASSVTPNPLFFIQRDKNKFPAKIQNFKMTQAGASVRSIFAQTIPTMMMAPSRSAHTHLGLH
jgi:hypothetical protein